MATNAESCLTLGGYEQWGLRNSSPYIHISCTLPNSALLSKSMVGLVLKIQFRSWRKAHVYNISLKILSCSACGNNKRWMRKLDSFPDGRQKATACTNLTGIELPNSTHFSLYSFITYPLDNYL